MEPASLEGKTAQKKVDTPNGADSGEATNVIAKKGLTFKRYFTKEGIHPFDEVEWNVRDAKAGDFFQKGVEAPAFWSDQTVGIVAKSYFATIDGIRESSVKTLIKRVVNKITKGGRKAGYFPKIIDSEDNFSSDSILFEDELTYIILHQYATFNSPVWFNFGVLGRKQCGSACFLLNVEDNMFGNDSISEWITNESRIFKSGAGSGVNLSKLRGSMEPLSTGGYSSGPISFMRVADANCGAIKAGHTRRGAKLVQLNIDHPDIIEFIELKPREDERMRILSENGINMDPSTEEGERNIAENTCSQNANISVRVSDKFMEAVEKKENWKLISRVDKKVVNEIYAPELLEKIARATWDCADPGIFFDDTINKYHTTPSLGKIELSNPCGETALNDNSSCNLGSLNLVKFINNDNTFNFGSFYQTVDIMITAMDITCEFSELPTKKITENTRKLRQLGLGYANLGAALMIQGMPYDSEEARDWIASVTSLMTGRAYRKSSEIASALGPFLHYKDNEDAMNCVIQRHMNACQPGIMIAGDDNSIHTNKIWNVALQQWDRIAICEDGFRNSQISVIAPTGVTSFMMGCDTTGCEPAFSLVTYKNLSAGGSMTLVNKSVEKALYNLGYDKPSIKIALDGLKIDGILRGIKKEHRKIFQTAAGENPISPEGHLKMVAAIQPHISGAASKTINCPKDTSVEDIYNLYINAWKSGIKCISIYREGSKMTEAISIKKDDKLKNIIESVVEEHNTKPIIVPGETVRKKELNSNNSLNISRMRMPNERKSITHKFNIGQHEGFVTAGMFEDGSLGEIFVAGFGKDGSTLLGMLSAWAISISIGLQHGVKLSTFVDKFSYMRFEPEGFTSNPEIRTAKSIVDYIMRWLVSKFGDEEEKKNVGIIQNSFTSTSDLAVEEKILNNNESNIKNSDKICRCGAIMVRSGVCYSCRECGASTGCG